MLASFVSLVSLNLTINLIQAGGLVAGSRTITAATATTPIQVTCASHGVAQGRQLHGIASGVVGMTELNGALIFKPIDANTLGVYKIDAQGNITPVAGTHAYVSGGTIQYAFPDFAVLLGRRNLDMSTSVAAPRIVFIPSDGRAWAFDAYGGEPPPTAIPGMPGTPEQQAAKTEPQMITDFVAFDVYVTGCAPTPDPDFGDFEATQQIVHALYEQLWNLGQERIRVLRSTWPSQKKDAGTKTQRGQQWVGTIEVPFPVYPLQAASFVPLGTFLEFTVQPTNPAVGDPITFDVQT